ncbi:hypothetical protein [Chryseobacterium sp. 2VB]|uniref:hypothetical protein n=1 Tax=Chryseobacterium sp. 2VB TaxID=2502204 RepID=UPI0010F79078|nr:hypothetical protein [Chryseobacterium sp. 2VB]
MKELEELTADIREKLPRLKNSIKAERLQDSKNNCWRIFMGGIFMGTTSNNELSKYVVNHINDYEIKINDVLEWHSKYYSKNSHFEVFNIVDNGEIYPAGVFIDYREEDPARYVWSLKKTDLKDQSPELIKFLHSLIKTKQ